MNAIVTGSLQAIAQRDGVSLAESFLNCEILALIDQSGSMDYEDAPGGISRYDAADQELFRLQAKHPGKVGVISFSDDVQFNPGGKPYRYGMGTDMARALDFVRVADGICQIVLISDGHPDSEGATLTAAAKFKNKINTVYIGPDGGGGQRFLERLAAVTGGKAFKSKEVGLLAESVEMLLLAG
jgi:hypothetical protein